MRAQGYSHFIQRPCAHASEIRLFMLPMLDPSGVFTKKLLLDLIQREVFRLNVVADIQCAIADADF
jgi:hypothetical protein